MTCMNNNTKNVQLTFFRSWKGPPPPQPSLIRASRALTPWCRSVGIGVFPDQIGLWFCAWFQVDRSPSSSVRRRTERARRGWWESLYRTHWPCYFQHHFTLLNIVCNTKSHVNSFHWRIGFLCFCRQLHILHQYGWRSCWQYKDTCTYVIHLPRGKYAHFETPPYWLF